MKANMVLAMAASVVMAAVPFCAFAGMGGDGVEPGENILSNPIFESDQSPTPAFWHLSVKGLDYSWDAAGGPDSLPAMRFSSATGGTFAVRQGGLRLCVNGRYRISCRVKAKDFSTRQSGFAIAEPGWRHPVGVKIPTGTYGWRKIEDVVEISRPTKDGTWFAVAHAERFTGELLVTDVLVTPADETSGKGTRFSKETEVRESPRLVPMKPILSLIPSDDRRVFFSFFGRIREGDVGDYEVRLTSDGATSMATLGREMFPVRLPGGANEGRFTAEVVRKAGGRPIFSREFPFRVVALPKSETQGRRLNNLVVELADRELAAGAAVEVPLAFRRRTWLHVAASAGSGVESATFDGKEMPGLMAPPHETFLEADAGAHLLSVKGAGGGRLAVRRIPEILDYQTGGGEFQRTRVFPAVTSINGIGPAKGDVKLFRDTGHLHIGNVGMTDFGSVKDLRDRFDCCAGLSDADYDGVACDELNPWSARKMSDFAEVLWSYPLPEGRRIYSWVVGKPFFSATDHDAISAALNVGGGRGRFMNEFYCRTRETEDEAREYVRGWLAGNLRAWGGFSPVLKNGYAPIFGAYTEARYGGTVAPHCEVDYRYFLDMQFNILVNDPEFEDIPCTGIWGTNYSDPELRGWTFRLLRHYCVEGNRTMLSGKFGLKYRPDHLANCDFADGLDGWRVSGDVRASRVDGFGLESEIRGGRGQPPIGDTFAELRGADAKVSQTAKGLVPGTWYLLEFKTFSPEDAKARRKDDVTVRADVKVAGGKVDGASVFAKVRRRTKVDKGASVTDNRIVFMAAADSVDLTFSAADGAGLGLNAISLRRAIELKP